MSKFAGAPPFAVLLVVAAGVIAAGWWWLGRPVPMPAGLGDPGPIQCVSYAPFRDQQSPFDLSLRITAAQVEEDLGKIAGVTKCIRTYAFKDGAEDVAAAAERLGIKVMQGMWLGRDRQKNRAEIDATVALAKRYPNTISSIIVGNEVLLRGELSPTDLGADHRRGEVEGLGTGHLRGRLGVLGAQSRPDAGRGFRDHSHPALLGGLSDPGRSRRRACGRDQVEDGRGVPGQGDLDWRGRLAEPGTHARGRAASLLQTRRGFWKR